MYVFNVYVYTHIYIYIYIYVCVDRSETDMVFF